MGEVHAPLGMNPETWGLIVRIIVTTLLVLLGLHVETTQLLAVVRPSQAGIFIPFLGTILSLIFIMPTVAFALMRAFSLGGPESLGFFLFACSPGGVFSNLASAAAGAHVPLNAALTCVSLVSSIGLLPFSCVVVIPSLLSTRESSKLPFSELITNMALIAVPLLTGVVMCVVPYIGHARLPVVVCAHSWLTSPFLLQESLPP